MKTDEGEFLLHEADMTIVLVWSEYDLHNSVDTDAFVLLLY